MTAGKLRTVIAKMLNSTEDEFIVNEVDLLNLAIDSASRVAENNYDFADSKVLVDLVIDEVAGGALSTCFTHGGDPDVDTVQVKTIIDIGPYDSSNIDICSRTFVSYDVLKYRQQRGIGFGSNFDPDYRYPGDSGRSRGIEPRYFIRGGSIFILPCNGSTPVSGTTHTVGLYISRYMPTLSDMEPDVVTDFQDFRFIRGSQFLQWQTILELNHISKEFVYRQEGNLLPPDKKAAEAWDAWVKQEAYQFDHFPEGHL